jgi:hypothetical protein
VRSLVPVILALLLVPRAGRAGQVPDPVFWESETGFVSEVTAGQFVDRIELHLLQYATDSAWRSEWAARRYAGAGILGAWGSTTGTELYSDYQIALNLFPAGRFQVRYDRREYREGRFDVQDQRFEALWYAGARWALVLAGWPAFEKERSSAGFGLRIGAPRGATGLDVRVMDERFAWNPKTDDAVRFTERPLRIVADGFWEGGRWRVRGSIDAGLAWAAEDRGPNGPTAGATARGFQRSGDVETEVALGTWTAAARLTGAALLREQTGAAGAVSRLERTWARGTLSARWDPGRWTASALAGWASQRDEFSSPGAPDGVYSAATALVGAEAGVRPVPELTVRLGYIAAPQRATRTVGAQDLLADAEEDAFLDKAHLRVSYAFGPRMAFDALLSQALHGGAFGGGSVKAVVVY